jgi:hypothetical protein
VLRVGEQGFPLAQAESMSTDKSSHVAFFDTTLRDGEQSPGCSMTTQEKLTMAHDLEDLGVDLFADDPLIFKKLIYEMRFDEVSARFGEFGPFYINMRLNCADAWEHLGL